jgi:UDP-N-acetyl-D-glucosamine dehydrogenase
VKVAVIGHGYVGAALCQAISQANHEVIAVDLDQEKVKQAADNYVVSNDFSLVRHCEIVILAVPTPINKSGLPIMVHLEEACNLIAPFIDSHVLVISESTSYPGTLRNIISKLLPNTKSFAVAPERVDPGNPIWSVSNTPRVIGALTLEALDRAVDFYQSFCHQVIPVSSSEIAESSKLIENTFRQVNLALVNELARAFKKCNIPFLETIRAASTKPFGYVPFWPSVGVGGHCIPIDPLYLEYFLNINGEHSTLVQLAHKINSSNPIFIRDTIENRIDLRGKHVQVSGVSYKENVNDVRESASLALIDALRESKATVIWHDPVVKQLGQEFSAPLQIVDIGIIAVDHAGVDYSIWKQGTLVIDLTPHRDLGFKKFFNQESIED